VGGGEGWGYGMGGVRREGVRGVGVGGKVGE